MKRLTLLRHAKSSWANADQSDIDRPLNERGRRDAPRMGQWLAGENLIPDKILCSAASRTQETLSLILPHFSNAPAVDILDGLYLASANEILAAARKENDEFHHLLIIGHNPGMEELAAGLLDRHRSDKAAVMAMAVKYPTAAAASFSFPERSWPYISRRRGALSHFMTPKILDNNK